MNLIRNSLASLFVALALLSLTSLGGCTATETRQSTGEFIDDAAITTRVKTALVQSPETSAWDIEVETFKGTVQLSGFVDSEEEKERAGRIARQVAGVQRVENNISVK